MSRLKIVNFMKKEIFIFFSQQVNVVVQIDWQQKKTLKTNNSLNSSESQSSKVLTRKDIVQAYR